MLVVGALGVSGCEEFGFGWAWLQEQTLSVGWGAPEGVHWSIQCSAFQRSCESINNFFSINLLSFVIFIFDSHLL